MRKVSLLSSEEREIEVQNILRYKCRSLTQVQLSYIMSHINTKHHYFIKSISCPTKFINIMTNEVIAASGSCLYSTVMPIYGSFTAGLFLKTETKRESIKGSIDKNEPAAGVKIELSDKKGFISRTYTLAVFEPPYSY